MIHPTSPSHVWNELGLSPAMPIPCTQALHTLSWSIVGRFCAGAAPAPKTNTKKYIIASDVMCMSKKVVITNLAEDEEGSYFVYILRRIVSKKGSRRGEKERA